MKKTYFKSVALLFSALMFFACSEDAKIDGTDEVPDPVLKLTSDTALEVDQNENKVSLTYEISNPVENAVFDASVAGDVDWISGFDTSVAGTVSFTVAMNPQGNPRKAVVTLSYRYSEEKSPLTQEVSVVQSGNPIITETVTFEDCVFGEGRFDNLAENGKSSSYSECGADFIHSNYYSMLGGVFVAGKGEKSDWQNEYPGIPSDKYVICNTEDFSGAEGSDKYSVWAFDPGVTGLPNSPELVFGDGILKKPVSAYVNNVAKNWQKMKIGFYSQSGFAADDYYEVVFTGYDTAGKATGRVTVTMADFRKGKSFIMEKWTRINLGALGNVNRIVLSVTATPKVEELFGGGFSICVDNMVFQSQK